MGDAWGHLVEVEGLAAAAVRRAMVTLSREGLVLADRFQGAEPRLQLGLESGTPGHFTPCWKPKRVKPDNGVFDDADVCLLLPPELWTNGRLATLGGRALLTYLVIQRQTAVHNPAFLADDARKQYYAIADEEVIGEGAGELDYYNIIDRQSGRYGRLEYLLVARAFARDAVDVLKNKGRSPRRVASSRTAARTRARPRR